MCPWDPLKKSGTAWVPLVKNWGLTSKCCEEHTFITLSGEEIAQKPSVIVASQKWRELVHVNLHSACDLRGTKDSCAITHEVPGPGLAMSVVGSICGCMGKFDLATAVCLPGHNDFVCNRWPPSLEMGEGLNCTCMCCPGNQTNTHWWPRDSEGAFKKKRMETALSF